MITSGGFLFCFCGLSFSRSFLGINVAVRIARSGNRSGSKTRDARGEKLHQRVNSVSGLERAEK